MKGIYYIKNLVNSKMYIGKSNWDIEERWRNHVYKLKNNCHDNKHLQRAFNLHGLDNFEFGLLKEVSNLTDMELSEIEKAYIQEYNSTDTSLGYNLTFGGEGYQFSHTAETKRKIAESVNQFWEDEERRNNSAIRAKAYCKNNKGNQLIEQDVVEIKRLLIEAKLTQKAIAKQFHVSPTTISSINKLKSWSYVGEEYNEELAKRAPSHSGGRGKERPLSSGSNNGRAILDERAVIQIKKYIKEKVPYKQIAAMFNTSESTVKAIKAGTRWAHVP